MNAYTKVFSGHTGLDISNDINEYIENCEYCDDSVRITAMTTIPDIYGQIVIVAFEKDEGG